MTSAADRPDEARDERRDESAQDAVEEHKDWTPGPRTKTAQGITITLLIVGLLTAIFVLQNTDSVPVNFLFWKASVPLAGALLLAVVLGGLLSFLVAFIRQRQYKRAMRKEHSVHARKR
jgi:uncharacterized integral membrane protein